MYNVYGTEIDTCTRRFNDEFDREFKSIIDNYFNSALEQAGITGRSVDVVNISSYDVSRDVEFAIMPRAYINFENAYRDQIAELRKTDIDSHVSDANDLVRLYTGQNNFQNDIINEMTSIVQEKVQSSINVLQQGARTSVYQYASNQEQADDYGNRVSSIYDVPTLNEIINGNLNVI